MATSGSTSKAIRTYWKLELEWRQVGNQDIPNNSTKVEVKIYWSVTGGSNGGSTTHTGTVNIGGQTGNISYNSSLSTNQRKLLGTVTKDITHDNEGKKKITISASIPINLTLNGSWVGTETISLSATLNDIPRASTITTFSNFSIGDGISWAVNRKISSFTHYLRLRVGSTTIANRSGVTAASGTITLTNAEKTDLLNQLSKSSKNVTVTLEIWTYRNATQTSANQVGSSQTKNATATAKDDDIRPSAPTIDVSENGQGLSGAYTQTKSKFKVVSSASGKYGATIANDNYRVTVENKHYYGNDITTDTINGKGTIRVTVRVTDTRNVTNTNYVDITVYEYYPPEINAFRAYRDDTTPTNLKGNYDFRIAPVNDKNSRSYSIAYRQMGAGSWTNITGHHGTNLYNRNTPYNLNGVLNGNYQYQVRILISDYYAQAEQIIDIPTEFQLMNFNASGKGIAFGGVSTMDALELYMPTAFQAAAIFNDIIAGEMKIKHNNRDFVILERTGKNAAEFIQHLGYGNYNIGTPDNAYLFSMDGQGNIDIGGKNASNLGTGAFYKGNELYHEGNKPSWDDIVDKPEKSYNQKSVMLSSATNISGTSWKDITNIGSLTITTSRPTLLYIQASLFGYVNTEVGNLEINVNGVGTGRIEGTNRQSIAKLTPNAVVSVGEGTHIIKLRGSTQGNNSTLTIPAWNNASIVAYEI